jgi:hypothetical protein
MSAATVTTIGSLLGLAAFLVLVGFWIRATIRGWEPTPPPPVEVEQYPAWHIVQAPPYDWAEEEEA